MVYDSRALHRGSANSRGSRILLLVSFQTPGAVITGPTYTISPKYSEVERAVIAKDEDADASYEDPDPDFAPRESALHANVRNPLTAAVSAVLPGNLVKEPAAKRLEEIEKRREVWHVRRMQGVLALEDFPMTPDHAADDFSFVKEVRSRSPVRGLY